jgi:hypothetical protein
MFDPDIRESLNIVISICINPYICTNGVQEVYNQVSSPEMDHVKGF